MINKLFMFFKRYQEQIVLGFSVMFLATLPSFNNLNSAIISILVAYWLLSGSFLNYKRLLNKYVILQVVFYLFFVVGLFISEDKEHASFLIQQKSAFLVFPVVLAMIPTLKKKTVFRILMLFVYSCLFYSLYSLIAAVYENYYTQHLATFNIDNFSNQKLASYIHFHSTYFSIYIVFSISILIHYFNDKEYHLHRFKPLIVLFLVIFSFVLILLAARMVLIAGLLLAVGFLVKNTIHNKKFSFILGGVLVVLVLSVFLTDNSFSKRAQQIYDFDTKDLIGSNNENGVTQRVFIWKNAFEVIKEKPIFGHGSGDVNVAFSRQYGKLLENKDLKESKRNAINSFKTENYNAHNQYIQILIAFGLIGLLFVLFLFFTLIRFAIREGDRLYLAFLLLLMMCLFTENLFDRQSGIVFFMFFNCLFLFRNSERTFPQKLSPTGVLPVESVQPS